MIAAVSTVASPDRLAPQSRQDIDSLVDYVERYFVTHKGQWPQVREAAIALGWRQTRVVDTVEGSWHAKSPQLTGFNAEQVRRGDLFVELIDLSDEVIERVRASVLSS